MTVRSPDETMTEWLLSNLTPGLNPFKDPTFTLGNDAELHSLGDDSAAVKVTNQFLASKEVKAHLDADKYVVKVGLEHDCEKSFVLNDDLSIKKLKFSDVILEQNGDLDCDDHLARLDADFILMAGEINRLIVDLLFEFGLSTDEYLEGKG